MSGKLFVISGASGVGKGTVLSRVMAQREDLSFSVSATTRPARPGEIDGVHYYFLSMEKFREMVDKDEFLEYDYHAANGYGTPLKQLDEKLQSGFSVVLCPPRWRSWNAGSGAGAIPPRSRSLCGWSGPNGKWSSGPGMTMWWSTMTWMPASRKF